MKRTSLLQASALFQVEELERNFYSQLLRRIVAEEVYRVRYFLGRVLLKVAWDCFECFITYADGVNRVFDCTAKIVELALKLGLLQLNEESAVLAIAVHAVHNAGDETLLTQACTSPRTVDRSRFGNELPHCVVVRALVSIDKV